MSPPPDTPAGNPGSAQELAAALERGTRADAAAVERLVTGVLDGTEPLEAFGGWLVALADAGETTAEIAGVAAALKGRMVRVPHHLPLLADTCGTGGDGSGSFNISTAAALVAAGAGLAVAKHGNRAVSSRTGSADVLERLGVRVDGPAATAAGCLAATGLCFCLAPTHHPAMRVVGPLRRSLGRPTVFNLVGPLCNPAGADVQVIGVGRAAVRGALAEAAIAGGARRVVVVSAPLDAAGTRHLDEVGICGPTDVIDIGPGGTRTARWTPEDFGLAAHPPEALARLAADGPEESAAAITAVLSGERGPRRDVVVVNAAAVLWAARRPTGGGGMNPEREAPQPAAGPAAGHEAGADTPSCCGGAAPPPAGPRGGFASLVVLDAAVPSSPPAAPAAASCCGGGEAAATAAPKPCCAKPEAGAFGWTCPMHPQVMASGPGQCPVCGMDLEPVGQPAGAADEAAALKRRTWISAILAALLMAVAMAGMAAHGAAPDGGGIVASLVRLAGGGAGNWLQLLLATPILFWGGRSILAGGLAGFRNGTPGMFSLISLGVLVAWGVSVVATVAPGIFPDAFRRHDGSVEVFFESVGMIVVLVLVGQLLESRARRGTTAAIRALLDLSPPTAERADDGTTVALALVRPGDRLRVRPGGRIPTDATVVEGRTTCDESLLTGEPLPVARGPGDKVLGGAINGSGSIVVEALVGAHDALVARIARLVRDAHARRAPIERLADRISAAFVPVVLGLALLTFLGWALFGPAPRLALGLLSAVSVLVIACPCALGLATPLSMTVAIGRGASAGILARSAEGVEKLSRVRTVVLDKTGTLTLGKPRIVAAVALADGGVESARDDALEAPPPAVRALLLQAAAVEATSEHPLSRAFAAAAAGAGIAVEPATDAAAVVGRGIVGRVGGQEVAVGSERFLAERGVDTLRLPTAATAALERAREAGSTVVAVAVDGRFAGLCEVSDPPRAEAAAVIATLRRSGLSVEMLSGDTPQAAAHVARSVGIERSEGGLSPEAKAQRVARLRDDLRGAGSVVFVGDGVNDAPALATADVGVAMGSGADVALETADITLLSGGLAAVPRAIVLARATMANVRQNLLLAFLYNCLAIPVAAGLLYPWVGHVTSPMLAAAAMTVSSLSVIANALRLRSLDLAGGDPDEAAPPG